MVLLGGPRAPCARRGAAIPQGTLANARCVPGGASAIFQGTLASVRCVAAWRRDGFVSLHADADGGELITSPLLTDPRWQLHVNCAAADGEVVVALCDHQGQPLNEDGVEILSTSPYEPPSLVSQPIRTDSVDTAVPWQNPRPLPQRPMALRFRMRNADLFSFWFTQDE